MYWTASVLPLPMQLFIPTNSPSPSPLHLAESTDVTLNSTFYHVVLPEDSVQTSGAYIFTTGLSRSLGASELILSATLSGDSNFQISSQTYVVTTNGALQAGRYTFDITLLYFSGQPPPQALSGYGIVDVVSRCKYKCFIMFYHQLHYCEVLMISLASFQAIPTSPVYCLQFPKTFNSIVE